MTATSKTLLQDATKTQLLHEVKARFRECTIIQARSDCFGDASHLWAEKGFPQKVVTVIMVGK